MITFLAACLALGAVLFTALMRELAAAPSDFPGPDGRSRDTGIRAGEECHEPVRSGRVAEPPGCPLSPRDFFIRVAWQVPEARPFGKHLEPAWQDSTNSFAAFCGVA